jgi:alpha-beta hydrolase superfamily lysophospholipase
MTIAGVAALAPASDLPRLVQRTQGTVAGRVVTSYLTAAYSAAFPDVRFDEVVRGAARVLARDIAGRCLADARTLTSVAEARVLGGSIFRGDPAAGKLGARLRENVPAGHIAAPLLIAQGLADELVLADVQADYVERQCRAGQSLTYLTYAGRDHVSLVAADSPVNADLIAWSDERFRGVPVRDRCPGRPL